MNIFDEILNDQEQRRREPSAKMSKDEAQSLLVEGITKGSPELVSLSLKNGGRVRGAVDGQDVFALALTHFSLPVFQLIFPDKKIKRIKDFNIFLSEGNAQSFEYFSQDLMEQLDLQRYACRKEVNRNNNKYLLDWIDTHFDVFVQKSQTHSPFKNVPNAFKNALISLIRFAGRMQHPNLMSKVATYIVSQKIGALEKYNADLFDESLDGIANTAKTVDALPCDLKNVLHTFLDLEKYEFGGNIWLDNAIFRNDRHIETVLKSAPGVTYVEKGLANSPVGEDFLFTNLLDGSVRFTTKMQNLLRLKKVYKDWRSTDNLNIVQLVFTHFNLSAPNEGDELKKTIEILLRLNSEAFHEVFPVGHERDGQTVFDMLSDSIRAQVTKSSLVKNLGASPTAGTSTPRKI